MRSRSRRPRTVLAPAVLACLAAACGAADLSVQASSFTAPPGSMAPALTSLADGRLVLSYSVPTPAGHAVRLAARGTDGAWTQLATIVENDSLFVNWADFPAVREMADGRLVASWLQKTAPSTYAYHVMMRVSEDGGTTWSGPFRPHGDTSPTEHGFVAMAPWQDGLAAIWLDGRHTGGVDGHGADGHPAPGAESGPAMTLRFTTITADGPAPDVEVDDRVCDCCQTDLVATPSGLVAAFRDRAPGEIRDVVVSRFVQGTWTAARKVYDDGWHYPGCPVNGPALAARGDTVAVAWFTNARDTAKVSVAFSTDGGASFEAPVRVDEGRPAGRVEVRWVGGTAVVLWLEAVDDAGAVRARTVHPSGRTGTPVTVAETSAARSAGFPRAAVLGDTLFVSWTAVRDTTRQVHVTPVTVR